MMDQLKDMPYWSLFLIVTFGVGNDTVQRFLPLASFDSRHECETAANVQSDNIIAHFENLKIYIKCIKTDEIVENPKFKSSQEKRYNMIEKSVDPSF